jgi:hypothetical protein
MSIAYHHIPKSCLGYAPILNCSQETQDRTRKRIREDITSAKQGYDEYAETLSKLKGRYIRRCQEAEVRSLKDRNLLFPAWISHMDYRLG